MRNHRERAQNVRTPEDVVPWIVGVTYKARDTDLIDLDSSGQNCAYEHVDAQENLKVCGGFCLAKKALCRHFG